MHETLNYSIHSSKKHRQYESNKVNNRPSLLLQNTLSLCPENEVGLCLTGCLQQMYLKYTWITGGLMDVCWKFARSLLDVCWIV